MIGSPCGLDWRAMTPRDGGRFCGDCKKVVHDLSSMSEGEAKALLRGPETANLCVRYVYDAHGKILFDQKLVAPAFLSRARRVVAAAALPLAIQACDAARSHADGAPGEVMGDIAYVEPDPGTLIPAAADASTKDASADAETETTDGGDDATDGGVKIY